MAEINMKRKRYAQLQNDPNEKLTESEKQDGWHFCHEWDEMLIQSTWAEFESCTCNLKSK